MDCLQYIILCYQIEHSSSHCPEGSETTGILSSMSCKFVWIFCLVLFFRSNSFFQSCIHLNCICLILIIPSFNIYTVYERELEAAVVKFLSVFEKLECSFSSDYLLRLAEFQS